MKKHLYLLLSLLLCSVIFAFTSCDNFMNGSNAQEQFEKIIDVANAKSYTIIVSQDTTTGSFLSSGDKECKIGYAIEVQYTVKKDQYIYKGLKAVSKSDPEKSLNDCVEFETIDSDDSRGLYKVSIKLVKESNDILIIPDCVLIPAVLTDKCKPDNYPNAWEQDSVINIVFNKPVVTTEFFIPTITDGSGVNLSSYFGEPYLSADSTILYIPIANGKQILAEDDTAETRDIIVTIDLSTIKDEEENYGIGTISHKYRVNKSKDNIKPEIKAVSLYSTSDKTKSYYKELPSTAYSNWTYNTTNFGNYNTNHVGSSVYVEFDAEDVGSGVSSFIVKETLIKNDQGISTGNITLTSKPQPAAKNEETGRLGASYTLATTVDGIVKLDFFACDNSGNISNNSISFYVLKDTTIKNDSISFNYNVSDLFVQLQDGSYLVSDQDKLAYISALNNSVNNNQQTVSLTIKENCSDIYYYDSVQAADSSDINSITAAYSPYDFVLYWSYSAENITTGPIVKQNSTYTFTRDVDKVVYIKIVATDSVGNTKEIVQTMAPRLKITDGRERDIDFENSDSLPTMCGADGSGVDIGSSGAWMAFFVQYNLTYGDTVRNYKKIVTHIGDVLSEIDDKDLNPTGSVKIYAIPKFGDITAPQSSNYFEYIIQGWNEDPGNGASLLGEVYQEGEEGNFSLITVYGKSKISDALPSSANAVSEYGPISESITVNVTPLQKTKLCKIDISNYIRNGFNADNYIFKFYQTEIIQNDAGEYFIGETTVYNSPNFYTPASRAPEYSLGFGIQIEAYSISDAKWYRPKEFLQKNESDDPGEQQDLTDTDIANAFLCKLYKLDSDFKEPMINMGWVSNGTFGYNSLFKQGGLYIYEGIRDEHNNLDKQSILSYYIIPNSDTKVSYDTRTFTLEELENYYSSYKKTMYYKPIINDESMTTAQKTIGVPFGNTEDGYYTIVVVAADKLGNTAILPERALILNKGELPWKCERVDTAMNNDGATTIAVNNQWKFSLNTKNNPEVIITETENSEYGFTQRFSSVVTYIDKIRHNPEEHAYPWDDSPSTILDDYLQEDSYEKHTSGNSSYYTISSTQPAYDTNDYTWDSWVRLRSYIKFSDYISEAQEWSDKGTYYFDYFYCGTNDTICYSKNCIEGLNGIQVISDRPVFAHTMYSDEVLTTSKYDDNAIRIWENKGVETGVRVVNNTINEDNSHSNYTFTSQNQENNPENPEDNPENTTIIPAPDPDSWHIVGSETYGNENLDSVPKGFWYTTIFHFADGSTAMTDIKQKY